MDKDAYIKQLETENTELKKRIEELERLLGMNSKNSSKPPSSDMRGVSAVSPKRRHKKRGARKGHQPHLRQLFPQDQVQHLFRPKPKICPCGCRHFEKTNEKPLRHQIVDVPPIVPEVTEYCRDIYRCSDCGALIYAPLNSNITRQHFGPGVLALVGILTGVLNTSKRKALAMMNEVFSVPMSLGGLSNCEGQLTDTLEQPYDETLNYVRDQDIAHADETGWRIGNLKKGWLWAFCCTTAAAFMVHANHGQKAAGKLIDSFVGKLVTDRYNAYNYYKFIRQICWAHLKRDFKAISEAKGSLGKIGFELCGLAKKILKMRKRVRDGTLQWKTFQRRMPKLEKRVESLLKKGACFDGKLGGKCRDILKHKQYLWTFVKDWDVEPTNNFAERIVRQGVLWRKSSFGTQSHRGARYVERILTVCATCQLQERSVIRYLRDACRCHLNGIPAPSLIKNYTNLTKFA